MNVKVMVEGRHVATVIASNVDDIKLVPAESWVDVTSECIVNTDGGGPHGRTFELYHNGKKVAFLVGDNRSLSWQKCAFSGNYRITAWGCWLKVEHLEYI